jgi:hypothetical protein
VKLLTVLRSVCPCDFKSSLWGLWPIIPYAEYNGDLPKTVFGSRPAFESMIRRLVLGRGSFPNIDTVAGTITSVKRDANHSSYIKSVSVRTSNTTVDMDASLVIDCTGPTTAGLKWLKAAKFDAADDTSTKGIPIDELRITYNHKTRYSIFHFDIPSDLGRRLPIPDGWDGAGPIYTCFTDSRVDDTVIYCHRVDGERRGLILYSMLFF